MNSPRICAVVVTCNRWACLQECLTGIKEQTLPVSEIFVIDNASEDGTAEGLSRLFPGLRHVRLPKNVGSSGGFFEGMKRAYEEGFDWLWVMDDDAVPEPRALQTMAETEVFARPDTGALAPRVLDTEGRSDPRSRTRQVDLRRFKTIRIFDGPEVTGKEIEINSATFVGLLIRRSVVEKIGLPRIDFFIAWDDIDYMHRLSVAGFKSYFVPKAEIVHLNAGTASQVTSRFLPPYTRLPVTALWKSYYTWRNRIYLVREYSSPYVLLRESCKLALGILLFDDHKLRRLWVLMRAVRDGAKGRLGGSPTLAGLDGSVPVVD
ncbi:MAG TPA: glycosyltransferase family 2 protein [Candidatus Acidoferrales bacterium]|nr:glycosyltransferase family 2 protein [Candidatus Acidoferrales bacterium]